MFWQSGSEQIKATATGATETVEAYVKLRVPSTGKLTVEKVDNVTGQALPNATIQLKQGGTVIATVTTGSDGKVTLPNEITPGAYQIHEISAPTGYFILDEPVSITIVAGQHHTVTIKDIPKSEIQLVKVDSVTNEPLDGVTFNIMKSDGTDIGDFVTANGGVISVGDLTAGTYIITEIATLPTHVLDSAPTTITLTAGETAVVKLSNIPYPTLEIIKLDEQDNSIVLEGFTFRLMETDGTVIGNYVTDANGRILIENTLLAGDYLIQEIAVPLPITHVLDDTIHEITLAWGETTSITLENTRTATLELLKRDSESEATIPNVSFTLYSPEGKNLGTFTTDSNGYILFSTELPPGEYTLIEVETSPIHILDNAPFTVTLLPGETTVIERENQRQKGRVQILKVSAGHNPITGDKENDTLQGAIFEMYNGRGELVEVLETDENGVSISGMHDIGIYTLKEVKAPDYYLTNGEPITVHIRCHLDVVKLAVKNPPVVPEVSVTKYGPAKAMAGTSIIYAFADILNTSNVPLRDFHWWDELPTEAVRLEQIETGTWNDKTVTIDLQIRTNKNKQFQTIKRSLTSYENHIIDCSPEALGFGDDEYVIEFRLWFGTVPMGFREVQRPKVTVRILDIAQDGYTFINETGVAGRYRDKWVKSRDECPTTATNPPKGILPRTGR